MLACRNDFFKSSESVNNHKEQDAPSQDDWEHLADTTLIEKFKTDNGNEIEFWGEQPFNLKERVVIKNKQGIKEFDLNNNSYTGNHTRYLWDSEDSIILHYGCGLPCWAAKVLPLNNKDIIREYFMYILADSTKNIIAYPDSLFYHRLVVENLKSGMKKNIDYEPCNAATPVLCIDTAFIIGQHFYMQWNSGTHLQVITRDTVVNISSLIE